MFVDYIVNRGGSREGHGEVGEALQGSHFDTGLMRPYWKKTGGTRKAMVTVNTGRLDGKGNPIYEEHLISNYQNRTGFVLNTPTQLRFEEWKQIDNTVIRAARTRLKAWGDLMNRSSLTGFNGMGKLMLEYENMSDPGEAFVDMDSMTEGRNDAPAFQLEGTPLPITHSDFWFSSRKLAISRNGNTPLDSIMAEAAGRRIAEKIEDTLIGSVTGLVYGPSSRYGHTPGVYGYTNYPARFTKTDMTAPTAGGWTPQTLVNEVIGMMQSLMDIGFYGPYMMYYSTDWDKYMNRDYVGTYGYGPMKKRLLDIDGLIDVRRLDRMTSTSNPYTVILVQMDPEVVRAVEGMPLTTVQWESMGGMRINFKVMTIAVPQFRNNQAYQTGIAHGTTS